MWDCGCLWALRCVVGAVLVWEWAAALCAGEQRANLGEKGESECMGVFAQIEPAVLGPGVWECGCLWAFRCVGGAAVVREWARAGSAGAQRADLGEKRGSL